MLVPLVEWLIHISLTRDFRNVYGLTTYRRFKQEFNKYEWQLEDMLIGKNLVDENKTCDIHDNAAIITFDGAAMIINNPVGFYLTKRFVKKKVKQMKSPKVKYKWD